MFQKFLDAGMAIAGVDAGESYGSPSGRAIYSSLYEELVQKRGLSKKPCLLARSRGGLMLYNWAVEHPYSVACIAGIYPVCNLRSYPRIENACGAYGMTQQQLTAVIAQHNPVDRVEPLAKAGVPVLHIHGDVDTVVPLETNSAELARRYRHFGGEMKLTVMKGQGHNMWSGWFQCQELVDFVIAHARRKGPIEPKGASVDNRHEDKVQGWKRDRGIAARLVRAQHPSWRSLFPRVGAPVPPFKGLISLRQEVHVIPLSSVGYPRGH